MAQTARNLFQRVEEWAEGPFIFWVFIAACFTWGIGANHFMEDTYSSFLGIQEVEIIYDLIPATWALTYWTMSLAPQFGQIIFTYLYLSDTRQNSWALWVSGGLFVMDFVADLYHRSHGNVNLDTRTAFAAGFTLVYFTFGSEVFITVSTGIILTTFPKAVIAFKKMWHDINIAISKYNPAREDRYR